MIIFIAIVILCIVLILMGLGRLGASQDTKQAKVAYDAIVKATVQCYALESRYPPSLKYLEDNYGVVLDHQKYVYDYRPIGENLMPQIHVFSATGSVAAGGAS
ncbi:MAG: hypothetical protein FWF33_00775 [Clostridiales bacterium]|nr:hypothetical protein [Clostridiales bacterium]